MRENWRLERLILHGFKSFAERTVLDFPDQVTGIIGPNGSGKSNLVEAIRFATGARAQEIRGQELKRLLFHGGGARPPLGFAEVVLELSRGGERLRIERRLEATGTLLKVNGRPTSAKALALHLAGTGLGRGGYAVVGQGEVGSLLEAPEEVLLAHLEEATGLRPVAEAARVAEERLEEAEALLRAKEEALRARREEAARLEGEARRAQRARDLELQALALRRSLLLARKEGLLREMAEAQARKEALREEAEGLKARLEALEGRRGALEGEAQALRERLEALRLLLKEREGLLRELHHLERLGRNLDRPRPEDPGPPPPRPPAPAKDLKARLQALRAQAAQLAKERSRREEALRRQATERARYEERLLAYERALKEAQALKARLEEREKALGELEEAYRKREALEAARKKALAQAEALRREEEGLLRLIQGGMDLQEGPRRVRGLRGVIGVVADLIRAERGLELALEVALGPRLQWVLVEDEEAAKGAIAYLKGQGGRATFLPLTLLRPPRLHPPGPAPGLLGPAYALARLRTQGLPEEAILKTLFGDTLVFEDLDRALAYLKGGGRERLVTLEGEVLERNGAITGGRTRGGGESLRLRGRLEWVVEERARWEGEAASLEKALQGLPGPRELSALQGEVAALRSRLAQPLPPRPTPPPEETVDLGPLEAQLEALEREMASLEEALFQAEAYARWEAKVQALREWERLEEERRRLEARLAELRARLEGYAPVEGEAEALRASLEEVTQTLRGLREEEARLLARRNRALGELAQLELLLARREATLEEVERELALLPETPRVEGSPRALQARLAQVEGERRALGPVNALAEGELAQLQEALRALEEEVEEARMALARLQAEAKAVERAYGERLKEGFARFQEAFRHYGKALLEAETEVHRTEGGLRLFLKPKGKRTQDLRLLSVGEKTLGALAFLFALGELQGGLPIAVLDEVDAALDEANLARFARFLTSGRQFLLVTHQKRTMEACQALYGVTAEEGVSRVYSIRRETELAPTQTGGLTPRPA